MNSVDSLVDNHGRRLAKSRVGSGWSWLSSTDALASQHCHPRHISPTRLFASRLPMVVSLAWGVQLCLGDCHL
ncbi:MAG: hypothetical protein FWC97_04530 [Treponema sp.]|nr:hypothetical protein [Treponema sp.]